jgi:FO synthase
LPAVASGRRHATVPARRRATRPRPVQARTSSRTPGKFSFPLTNLCRDYCGYCTFRHDPARTRRAHHDAPRSPGSRRPQPAKSMGCTEALFSLGDKPELLFPRDARHSSPSRLQIHAALSGIHVRPGSPRDRACSRIPIPACISARVDQSRSGNAFLPSMGLMLESTSQASTRERGRARQRPRQRSRPKDCAYHRRGRSSKEIPFTTGVLIGIGETVEDRVDTLAGDPRPARPLRPYSGSDRPELPRQALDPDGRRALNPIAPTCCAR